MAENNINGYLRWITPSIGDPTFSLLKAHLLFEELLHAYLSNVLPHASALQGARLTFAQVLAVARASSTHAKPDHWIWKAIGDLNKLRNMLSHQARPKDLAERLEAYAKFIAESTNIPLPPPAISGASSMLSPGAHAYTTTDIVTVGLYYYAAGVLGFNVQALVESESDQQRKEEVSKHVPPSSSSAG